MSDISSLLSISSMKLDDYNGQGVYGAGFFTGRDSSLIKLGPAKVGMINGNYKWVLSMVAMPKEDEKKFIISAKLATRYVFDDEQKLHISLKQKEQLVYSEDIVLDKLSEEQKQIEIVYDEAWNIPFNQIEVYAVFSVSKMKYYLSNWATDYNFKDCSRAHDVILVVGDTQFYVLRSYLATWSRYFDRLFYGDFMEKNQKEIKIGDVDPKEFELILHLIHPQLLRKVNDTNALNVLKLADRLEIPNLMAQCGTILCDFEKFKDLDVLDRLELGDNHSLVHVQIACFERIHKMEEKVRIEFFDKNRRRIQKLSSNVVKNLI